PWEGGRFVIARLEVTTEANPGAPKLYQLPLSVRTTEEIGDTPPTGAIARVVADDGEGLLFDAVEDRGFLRALGDAVARGADYAGDRAPWTTEPLSANSLVVPPTAEIRVGSVEQSNTSVILGEQAIL